MARLDVYRDPQGRGYVVDLQSDAMSDFRTTVIAPLWRAEDGPPIADRLNPVIPIKGDDMVMYTQYVASIERKHLGDFVTNVTSHHDDIVRALDWLFLGH